jgi:arsenite methyltransferase
MTGLKIAKSPALDRALELLADPPPKPDTSKGYLDLLGTRDDTAVADRTRAAGALFTSPVVSMLYDNSQAVLRKLLKEFRPPIEWLSLPAGGIALDVGCGPGNVTASLARAAGPGGLALGLDVSAAMLARAVHAQSGPQVGFLRADAQRLPLRDTTVDAVVSIAALQHIPDPAAALAEMARVLRPDGRLAVMVPTAGRAARFWAKLPNVGVNVFDDDELGDILEQHSFVSVRTSSHGAIQWVRAKRG